MSSQLHLFGSLHLLILGSVAAVGALLSVASRRSLAAARSIRYGLAVFLALNELVWYGYRLHFEGFRFPEGLPLQLCDLTLWLTVAALFTLKPLVSETAYFAGLGGSGMALLTPDLWAPLVSYPTTYFFLSHGMVVAGLLTLVGSRQLRLRPGSPWKAFGVLNIYTGLVAIFDAAFKTNYMYLCTKPAGASLLDFLGPWPLYILAGELVALVLFCLLWKLGTVHSNPDFLGS